MKRPGLGRRGVESVNREPDLRRASTSVDVSKHGLRDRREEPAHEKLVIPEPVFVLWIRSANQRLSSLISRFNELSWSRSGAEQDSVKSMSSDSRKNLRSPDHEIMPYQDESVTDSDAQQM